MLTVEQIEPTYEAVQRTSATDNLFRQAELPLRATFSPLGFPVEVRSNSEVVLRLYEEMWGKFAQLRNAPPIRCDVQVVEGHGSDCPPAPVYRLMLPFMTCVADADNYSIVDLEREFVRIDISLAALRYPLYAQYFLMGTPVCCIATGRATPVHAGCVSLEGRGVLLCGDSGAGKSTLSYACARAGWAYTSDDASYLLDGGVGRLVTGNCHQVRFRPSARKLFAELEGQEITPRAAGKPSIELPTAPMSHITSAATAQVDFVVYVNRRSGGAQQLVPYSRDAARKSMREVLYGPPDSLARQHAAVDQLLTADVLELRYTDLNWAIDRLQRLVTTGQ